MNEVFNVGKTILLDGKPLSLVRRAGVEPGSRRGSGRVSDLLCSCALVNAS